MNIEAKIIIFLSPKAFYFIFFYPYKKNWSTAGTNSKLQEKKMRAAESALSYFFVLLQRFSKQQAASCSCGRQRSQAPFRKLFYASKVLLHPYPHTE